MAATPDNVLHVVSTSTAGASIRFDEVSGKTDVYYRFYIRKLGTLNAVSTLLFSQSSAGTGHGDVALRIGTDNKLQVRWNNAASPDWTDTVAVANGDLVELHHHFGGTGRSGYEVRRNQQISHSVLTLDADVGATASFVSFGLNNAGGGEIWLDSFGASDTTWMGPVGLPDQNQEKPTVTILSPTDGTTLPDNGAFALVVTASDPDGISSAEYQVDSGSWADLTYDTPSARWGAFGSVPGGSHAINVRATDNYSDPTQQLTSDVVTVTVTVPVTPPPPPPPPPPPVPLPPAQFVVQIQDHNGNVRSEVSAQQPTFGKTLDGIGFVSFAIPRSDKIAQSEFIQFIQPYLSDFLLLRVQGTDKHPIMGGILNDVTVNRDDPTFINVSGQDWLHYLERRVMPIPDPDNPVDKTYSQHDLFDAIRKVVRYVIDDPILGLVLTYSSNQSGIVDDYHFAAVDLQYVYEIITTYAQEDPGFDFEITWDKHFNLYAPEKGSRVAYVVSEDVNVDTSSYEDAGIGGNNTIIQGSGTGGASAIRVWGPSNDSALLASATKFRQLDVVETFSNVATLARVQTLAKLRAAKNANESFTFSLRVVPRNNENLWAIFDVGDSLQVQFNLDYEDLNGYYRVLQMENAPADNGSEGVLVTFQSAVVGLSGA